MGLVISEEAIKRGFRIEKGLVVKYTLDDKGKILRKRKNWKSSIRGKSRQYIQDNCENRRCSTIHNLTIHHILPLSKGGDGDKENCKTLCRDCHDKVHGIPGSRKKKNKVKKVKKVNLIKSKILSSGDVLIVEKGLWGEYRIV